MLEIIIFLIKLFFKKFISFCLFPYIIIMFNSIKHISTKYWTFLIIKNFISLDLIIKI